MIAVLLLALSSNANLGAIPHSYFFGRDAGLNFRQDTAQSHVFCGNFAGNWWVGTEKICPLFILTDSNGNQLVTIDRNGRVRRKASARTIKAAFSDYRMDGQ